MPFCVCRKYNIGIIVDLHAAPGSQNRLDHSASRDGSLEWGTSAANIAQTVDVIDFLASRSIIKNWQINCTQIMLNPSNRTSEMFLTYFFPLNADMPEVQAS